MAIDLPCRHTYHGVTVLPMTPHWYRMLKARRYAELGLPHSWLVDPEGHRVECHRAQGGAYALAVRWQGDQSLTHPDCPEFSLSLAVLWR